MTLRALRRCAIFAVRLMFFVSLLPRVSDSPAPKSPLHVFPAGGVVSCALTKTGDKTKNAITATRCIYISSSELIAFNDRARPEIQPLVAKIRRAELEQSARHTHGSV